ncbi:GbsR/MarR family transcriptional regulator [Actinomadura fibrosa]|uniref:GbsR/MarR family transcriptional regulator n=1 Tax=Actinomadura fibrosa TaxID=111802 RepID=A0ABW2XJS4_9ACTN|nr:transcriptional regulator [Actinomadura fibrosa]
MDGRGRVDGTTDDQERILEWVERAATFCMDEYAVPPIAGRVLAWLMICDPPEQPAGRIAEAIGASSSSLATSMRLLTDAGFVRRSVRPGRKTHYYRVDDGAWERIVRRRIEGLAAFREITAAGMELAGPDPARTRRLRVAHDVFDWMDKAFASMPGPRHEGDVDES